MRSGVLHPNDVVLLVNPVLDTVAVVDIVLEEALQFAPELFDLAGHSPFRGGPKEPQCFSRPLRVTDTDVAPALSDFLT
ncbi:MAG: hypothetical protein DRN08_07020 [Thermoplasmata archaeon]|nr:MAG: hypothetical protein DRN08_07020 [Thermoplasmata archaeon]